MTEELQLSDDEIDDGYSTSELIADAKRPTMIARHRDMIAEMESGISDAFVSGTLDHPRFQAMVRELEAPSEQQRIQQSLQALADDEHYQDQTVQEAVIDYGCLLREERGIEVAVLQLHIIGIYRRVRSLMLEHQTLVPDLDDLRTLPVARLGRVLAPIPIAFGVPGMDDGIVVTGSQAQRMVDTIRQITSGRGGDDDWCEHNNPVALPRNMEEPLLDLPVSQRQAARERLIGDRIRSKFFRDVFLRYFDRDTLGPEEIDAHRNILHWIESIFETPHLYPFMQGQTDGQKTWRLSRLLRKVIQINEIYQRIALASQHPTYAQRFEGLRAKEKLAILAKDHYPPCKVDDSFMITTALCPFANFAAWVQEQVGDKNFVLPPERRR